MRWKNYSLFVWLAFLFVFGFTLLKSTGEVYAKEDLTVTLGNSNISICSGEEFASNSICGYKYIMVDSVPDPNSGYIDSASCQFIHPDNLVSYASFGSWASPFSIYTVAFSTHYSELLCRKTRSSSSVTITLTDSYDSATPLPSGTIDITENGEYDVSSYATANVNIENEVIQGDYHDDLIAINQSILICGAICLVLYFFYCIYRMIIKTTGSY